MLTLQHCLSALKMKKKHKENNDFSPNNQAGTVVKCKLD